MHQKSKNARHSYLRPVTHRGLAIVENLECRRLLALITVQWTGGAGNNDWSNALNWQDVTNPMVNKAPINGGGDTFVAVFNGNATPTIDVGANNQTADCIKVNAGVVQLDTNGKKFTFNAIPNPMAPVDTGIDVAPLNAQVAELQLNGAGTIDARGVHLAGVSATGTLTVTDHVQLNNSGLATVGAGISSSGTLVIDSGAIVTTDFDLLLGNNDGAIGQVSLDSAGKLQCPMVDVKLGQNDGSGILTAVGGATVTSVNGIVETPFDGVRSGISLSGTDTSWIMSGGLQVGTADTAGGDLGIHDGAYLQTVAAQIWSGFGGIAQGSIDDGTWFSSESITLSGDEDAISSSLTVTGNGSIETPHLTVGNEGKGSLYLNDGGSCTVNSVIDVASSADAAGSLIQLEGESVLTLTDVGATMEVGKEGAGTVTVTESSLIEASNGSVAIGVNGAGTLNLTDGGRIVSDTGAIGATGIAVAILIDDARWALAGSSDLEIGANGGEPAEITVKNGGSL